MLPLSSSANQRSSGIPGGKAEEIGLLFPPQVISARFFTVSIIVSVKQANKEK
jgi:hypothetical protein